MTGRRRAREITLQILYQIDLNPTTDEGVIEAFLRDRLRDVELIEFARSLVNGVRRNRVELDTQLEQTADNWNLQRMAAIDRNVLRLGAYEILFAATPQRVAINEAVELAKRFGGADSSRFVNGILDRFLSGD